MTLLILVVGAIIDVTPRRFVPDRLVRWYNDQLEHREWR